jgi:hypothetical protein
MAVAICGLLAAVSLPNAQGRSPEAKLPEIGVTYTHPSIPSSCDLNAANGLLKTYHWPGVRTRVQRQLAAMRAAGIDSIRILIWHLSEPASSDTNNLPSAGGRLVEPYRTNLIRFSADVRSAGFKSMVVEYSPQWTNNPIGEWGPNGLETDRWDPRKFAENWSFVRDTRELIKRNGPAESWFDPASEMAPDDNVDLFLDRRLDNYLTGMYRRYVEAFGKDDVVFFVATAGPYSFVTKQRYTHLIEALRSAAVGMPSRFGIHPDQSSPGDLVDLRDADEVLRANGLDQPLMIGEMVAEGSKSAAAGRDIAEFARTTERTVADVYLWFWRSDIAPHDCLSAPYRADSYISAFTGTAVSSTLSASVRGQTINFRTPYGQSVSALDAGDYRIRVIDRSARANFHLVGPKVDRKTAIRSTASTEMGGNALARRLPLRLGQRSREGTQDPDGPRDRLGPRGTWLGWAHVREYTLNGQADTRDGATPFGGCNLGAAKRVDWVSVT